MQLIRNKTTLAAVYLLPDDQPITLDATGLHAGYLHALDITPTTHEVVAGVPEPTTFVGGALTWDGVWVVTDQAAIDAAIERAKPPVPQEVSIREACQALEQAGLLDDIETAIAAAPRSVQIDWARATTVRRDWPTLLIVQQQMGLTDKQIDDLFTLASTL